jgi:hypothetical protein
MPVVDVRVVRVGVPHRRVVVRVAVRLAGRVVRAVGVLVVYVVDMGVVVEHLFVVVFVPLHQVQPHPDANEGGGQEEGSRGPVAENGE